MDDVVWFIPDGVDNALTFSPPDYTLSLVDDDYLSRVITDKPLLVLEFQRDINCSLTFEEVIYYNSVFTTKFVLDSIYNYYCEHELSFNEKYEIAETLDEYDYSNVAITSMQDCTTLNRCQILWNKMSLRNLTIGNCDQTEFKLTVNLKGL
jgi:hypothetical protein